jgi:hypothetical protein
VRAGGGSSTSALLAYTTEPEASRNITIESSSV